MVILFNVLLNSIITLNKVLFLCIKLLNRMKKTILFTLLFFSFLCTNAQNKTLSRTILWENPKIVSHYYDIKQKNINKTTFLSFDNANYYDHENLLPYYFELIETTSDHVQLKIVNVSYKTLSNNELKTIKNKNNIRSKLEYSYAISKKRN